MLFCFLWVSIGTPAFYQDAKKHFRIHGSDMFHFGEKGFGRADMTDPPPRKTWLHPPDRGVAQ